MTNPIHDRIGGKYHRRGSSRYWFYGFATIIFLIWLLVSLDTSDAEPLLSIAVTSICASSVVVGVVALFAAPFAAQVVSQMRQHEAYELIQITTLSRQQLLFGLMSGILARFRGGVGFPLLMMTLLACIGVAVLFLFDNVLGIMVLPLVGMFGLCYLGLMGGIASGLIFKNTIGANILALVSHFIVVTVWFFVGYSVVLVGLIFYVDDFPGYYSDLHGLLVLAARTAVAPYLLALIPLAISYIMIRRT